MNDGKSRVALHAHYYLTLLTVILITILGWPTLFPENRISSELDSASSLLVSEIWRIVLWAIGSIGLVKIMQLLWERVLQQLSRRKNHELFEMMSERTGKHIQLLTLFVVLNIAAHTSFTAIPDLLGHVLWSVILGVLYTLLVVSIALFVHASMRSFIDWYGREVAAKTASNLDDQFVLVFQKTAGVLFAFIAVTIVLGHFGVQITGLLATAGVASIAIALAAQETLSNIIAGFAVMTDQPFKVGDRIELNNGKMGDVLDVGLRSTRIMAFDNTVINIPNAEIAKAQIINLSAPNASYKIRATIGVAYGTDLRKVKLMLLEIFAAHPDIAKEPAPVVYFTEFAESSLNLFYVCWVPDYREQFRIRDELNMAIKDRFEFEKVEIPFPQRVVHVRTDCASQLESFPMSR